MGKTTKKGHDATKADPRALEFRSLHGESESDSYGRNVILPVNGNAVTIKSFSPKYGDNVPLMGLVNALRGQAEKIHGGDLKRAETMLIAQAHTLDSIFNCLAQRAALNLGEYINAADIYLRLALKAQSQCRTTLESLAAIKNPPIIYAKQANFAAGPQQVNNGLPAQAGENKIPQNKLLEQKPNEWLDTGTTNMPSQVDKELEAVEAFDGTA